MFMVYWSVTENESTVPQCREFPSNEMAQALQFTQDLRARQHSGEPIQYVSLAAENKDSVGLAGVADPAADYSWKKRRM